MGNSVHSPTSSPKRWMGRLMPSSGTLERVEARVAGSVPVWVWSGAVKVLDAWDVAMGEVRFRLLELLAARAAQADPEARAASAAAVERASVGSKPDAVLPTELRKRWLKEHAV
jgi:hypothetical protein